MYTKKTFSSSSVKKSQIAISENLRKNILKYFCFSLTCIAVFLSTNASGLTLNSLSDIENPNNVTSEDREGYDMLDSLARLIYRAVLTANIVQKDKIATYDRRKDSELPPILRKPQLLDVHSVSIALYKPTRGSAWTLAVASNVDIKPELFKAIINEWVLISSSKLTEEKESSRMDTFIQKKQEKLALVKQDLESQLNRAKQKKSSESKEDKERSEKLRALYKNIQRDIDMAKLAQFCTKKFKESMELVLQSALKYKRIVIVEGPEEMHSELKLIEFLSCSEDPELSYLKNKGGGYVQFQYIGTNILNCKKCNILIKGESKDDKTKKSKGLLKCIVGFNEDPTIYTWHSKSREFSVMNKGKSGFVVFTRGYFDSGYPEFLIPDWSLKCNELEKKDEKYILGRLNVLNPIHSQHIHPNELLLNQHTGELY